MKTLFLTLIAFFVTLLGPISAEGEEKDIYPRWTVVGAWNVTHPYWTDVLTFRDDGTFSATDQTNSGRWTLTAESGTPLLVLRWNRWGTESLLMVHQKHFRGQFGPGSYIDMRRDEGTASQ